MLNEGYTLLRALQRAGIALPAVHPRVRAVPKSAPCLRVRLGEHGHVAAVEQITEKEWPSLWRIVKASQGTFPVVKINQPILAVPAGDRIWQYVDREERHSCLDALEDVLEHAGRLESVAISKASWPWKNARSKAAEVLTGLRSAADGNVLLQNFIHRFGRGTREPAALLTEIASHGVRELNRGRLDSFGTIKTLMIGNEPSEDGSIPKIGILLAFDISGQHKYTRRLYSQDTREKVIDVLPAYQQELKSRKKHRHRAQTCALTGCANRLQEAAFPQVPYRVIGKGALVSMFSDAPCNERYGLTDYTVVPVAQQTALKTFRALTWIVSDEREGKTWRGVASGQFQQNRKGDKVEKKDLLVVYVDSDPIPRADLANIIGRSPKELKHASFEEDASAVCAALAGIAREEPRSKLGLLIIRRVSPGQVKTVLADSPTVEDVLKGAEWWQKASANVPDISLPLPEGKGKRAVLGRPLAPYPEQVVRLLSEQWISAGTRSNKVEGIGLGEVLDVLLSKPGEWEDSARQLLELTLRRSRSLLLGLFGVAHSGTPAERKTRWQRYPRRAREKALQAASVLSIALQALGRSKENYMNESAFQIGRLLHLTDTLHREYCVHVRGGNIPPQLIGSAMMPVAADNPEDAVDRLRERINVYVAWAKKIDGEEYRLVKWVLGQIGEVCHLLSELSIPTETDRKARAELFLGYMARHPAGEDDDDENSQEENTNVG